MVGLCEEALRCTFEAFRKRRLVGHQGGVRHGSASRKTITVAFRSTLHSQLFTYAYSTLKQRKHSIHPWYPSSLFFSHDCGDTAVLHTSREAEVTKYPSSTGPEIDQDVGGLDVAVYKALAMQVPHCIHHTSEKPDKERTESIIAVSI